jgi:putative iron-regulated protein
MMRKLLTLLFLVFVSQACDDDEGPSVLDQSGDAITNYADIVYASYQDSYSTAEVLKQKIDAFVAAPSEAGFQQCKDAWLAARNPYGQTEAYRFYGGPIDDDDGPEGLINAWPMDEGFIDYVADAEGMGLINNPEEFPTISKTVLAELNESISETSIFTGYHAIEFLLWGQDLSSESSGERPYTDYVVGENGTADNQQRRGEYLKAVAELLLDNLASVRDEWAPGAAYREAFVKRENIISSVDKIFTSLGELSKGELSGERMFVAVDTEDQEHEHSCFSDNTIADIKMNFKGLQNVYFGSYTRTNGNEISGKSFHEIATSLAPEKAAAVVTAFANAEAKINLIQTPFDRAIIEDSADVLTAVEALSDLSDLVADVSLSVKSSL